jgi:hypothetical protein
MPLSFCSRTQGNSGLRTFGTASKLYSEGALFDVEVDPEEQHDLAADLRAEVVAAKLKLEAVLAGLPEDMPPPFPLRSQSGFKIRTAERAGVR